MWLKDAYLGGWMEKQRWNPSHQEEEDSEDSDNHAAARNWYYKGEPVAQNSKAWRQPPCTRSQFFSWQVKRIQKQHGTTLSTLRRTHRTVWKSCPPWSGRCMKKPQVRSCGRFECEFGLVNVHEYHSSSSGSSRKRLWHEFKICEELSLENKGTAFFRETEKLISGQTETTGISLINFQELRWVSTSLLHSRAYQHSTAKVYVFSNSVLCLGKMGDNPVVSWKKQIQWYSDNNYFSELNRIDGQPIVRVEYFPRIHYSGNPQ